MASIEKALQIAARAHEGQKDKDGQPYILHPLRVMNAVEGEPAKVVAVLHDVIEDTSVTAEDLRREGFDEAVLAAVECLTHRKGEPYADYVVRCKGDVTSTPQQHEFRSESENRIGVLTLQHSTFQIESGVRSTLPNQAAQSDRSPSRL